MPKFVFAYHGGSMPETPEGSNVLSRCNSDIVLSLLVVSKHDVKRRCLKYDE